MEGIRRSLERSGRPAGGTLALDAVGGRSPAAEMCRGGTGKQRTGTEGEAGVALRREGWRL